MNSAVNFEGVFPILVTPFMEDGQLDLESFDRLIRFMVELGVDGVTILGVLGESNRVTDRERERAVKAAVAAAGAKLPIVVGTSHRGTLATRELSQMAEELGAAAVMVTPSQEPGHNEERIYQYYRQVAEGMSLPIVVQDHPASTQVQMSVPLLLRLVEEVPQVACFKQESVPTPPKTRLLIEGMTQRKVPILTGLGALYGLFDLLSGSSGFMTGFAFPEVLMGMVKAMRGQQPEQVAAIYQRFLPLIVFEQQPGIAVRKEIFRLRGVITSSAVRHPGAGLQPFAAEQLQIILNQVLPGVDLTKPLTAAHVNGTEPG
ncbi:MAG: dihydrodipicolinate synthase family protein [Desulfuromonas sp.]|nr:MAG: dihydrodipicolinate synthase family protein [Desulfuromonas sp.]